jgi:hypothetical protein
VRRMRKLPHHLHRLLRVEPTRIYPGSFVLLVRLLPLNCCVIVCPLSQQERGRRAAAALSTRAMGRPSAWGLGRLALVLLSIALSCRGFLLPSLRAPLRACPPALRAASDSGGATPPPDPSSFQSVSQKRRNLPLSQLKRKRKNADEKEEYKGELRPLIPKASRQTRLQGEDYWIGERVDSLGHVAYLPPFLLGAGANK